MALVAYDYGSESEESDTELPKTNIEIKENVSDSGSETVILQNDKTPELFSKLPQTKSIFQDVREDKIEDFIPKGPPFKEKQKVRITIPSLSQFKEEEDEPKEKKFKSSMKGSGLMALLPPAKTDVKTQKMFVPHSVVNKSKTNSTSKVSIVNKINKKTVATYIQKPVSKSKASSDVESDDDIDIPETFDDDIWEKVCSRPKPKPKIQDIQYEVYEEVVNIAPEPEQPYDGLDNQAFKELVGKTKRPIGNIKLIDIHEEEILPDKDLWLTKSLTDPEMAPKDKVEEVDPTRRKKHHITYLAQQAKANEQELQSAWAASKNNRQMSRAKYGF